MTPASEKASLADDVRHWRMRAYVAAATAAVLALVIVVMLAAGAPVANEAMTACGAACGSGRVRIVKRSACECHDAQPTERR